MTSKQKLNQKERLIWLLQTILKEQTPLPFGDNCTMVELDKLTPHLDSIDPYQDFYTLLEPVINDKDFYRKHNMLDYEPSYNFDYSRVDSKHDIAVFCDFTNDFLKTYLEDRLGIKRNTLTKDNKHIIQTIEVLEDKTELKAIVIYINGNYNNPIQFNRRKYFSLFYNLARDQEISYRKGFFDYFNSNTANPLYKNTGFKRSSIIKKEYDYIKPNIPIILKTQKFISQAINKTSLSNKKLKSA